jgi:putative ABC transport system substrate-binding protein
VFCIKRREFVSLLGGATVAWPFAALAQKPDRPRRIGVLMSLGENDPEGKAQLSGFAQGLAGLGWSEGPKLGMDVRWGGGDLNKIRTFAKELVAMQPDVILSQGTPVTAALQQETRTIPIVFVVVTDPVGEGLLRDCPFRAGISPASSHQKPQWAARCWTCSWISRPASTVSR